jgi:hypothetical protein
MYCIVFMNTVRGRLMNESLAPLHNRLTIFYSYSGKLERLACRNTLANMRIAVDSSATLLSLLALTAVAEAKAPESHPSFALLSKFSPHFRCPYAEEWIAKGPKQAALDLGLWKNSTVSSTKQAIRRRLADEAVAGSCVYTNSWTGTADCLEMRGDGWTDVTLQDRCASEKDGTLSSGLGCSIPENMAGWCVVGSEGSIEATPMAMTGAADCAETQNVCVTFMQGTFESDGQCASGSSATNETDSGSNGSPYAVPDLSEGPPTCAIAPGE